MTMTDLPPVLWEDEPRARRTDPDTSQVAADKSAEGLSELRLHVLELVRQEGELIGSEANDLYILRQTRNDWPRVAWDSPRKRMGELAAAGYLTVVGTRPGNTNSAERVFSITEKGLEAIFS